MPHLRYKTLDEFRAVIAPFEYDAYMNRPYEPFVELMVASAIEVPHYNYAQFHRYAAVLMECAKSKGVDKEYVRKWIDYQHRTQLLHDDLRNRVVLYIKKVMYDPTTANQISILPLMCGAGNSTAISYLIKDVLEQPNSDGKRLYCNQHSRAGRCHKETVRQVKGAE